MDASIDLNSGQLVRYLETASRWYFARVRRIRGKNVDLSFFDGTSVTAPRKQVHSFEEFLNSRKNTWSRTRSQLTENFYGRPLDRLRTHRFREMKRMLRNSGITFKPESWPSAETRIQLWRDTSVVPRAVSPRDRELASLIPCWLDPQQMPPGSRDPLGLQAHAEHIANKILPGLTVNTTRIGYYGFLCWAIEVVNHREPLTRATRREMLHQLERALVLCEFVYHGAEDDSCRIIGQRNRMQVLQSAEGGCYRVPSRILKNQNTAGALRLYATSLTNLSFVEDAPELAVDSKLPWVLTNLGRSLSQAFARRVPNGFVEFAFGDNGKTREESSLMG